MTQKSQTSAARSVEPSFSEVTFPSEPPEAIQKEKLPPGMPAKAISVAQELCSSAVDRIDRAANQEPIKSRLCACLGIFSGPSILDGGVLINTSPTNSLQLISVLPGSRPEWPPAADPVCWVPV